MCDSYSIDGGRPHISRNLLKLVPSSSKHEHVRTANIFWQVFLLEPQDEVLFMVASGNFAVQNFEGMIFFTVSRGMLGSLIVLSH